MLTSHFKDAAKTLVLAAGNAGVTLNTYDILNLTDALISLGANFTAPESDAPMLVTVALNTHEVMQSMYDGKKINAIKALRAVTGCGLKEAKDAVEDSHVAAQVALYSNPWVNHHDRDEPQF